MFYHFKKGEELKQVLMQGTDRGGEGDKEERREKEVFEVLQGQARPHPPLLPV